MVKLGTEEMAKYPFLAESGQYLKDKGFTLEQFGTDPDLKSIIDKAYSRIEVATTGKIYRSDFPKLEALDFEVFSFLIAVILLKLCGINTLIKRFSLAEARRAEGFLEKDLKNFSDKTQEEFAIKIIKDLSSVAVKKEKDAYVVPIPDYLKHASQFHEREWKLINRKVDHGIVFLTPHETVRLIRKEIEWYINSKINSVKTPSMIEGFQSYVDKLNSSAKKFRVPTITSSEYPPCIKHAIETLDKGENLSHSGRFMLATYLLSIGKSIEQIAPLFKNAPDYNEKITLYQLNHLSGNSTGTEYKCPSCEKIKRQNHCFATSDCDGIFNPLQFKKKKVLNA